MKRTFAVLAMIGALLFSAPLSAQSKPNWEKLPANSAAPLPANEVATVNEATPQGKPTPTPQAPPVREAPSDLQFPELTGRVVDEAGLLTPAQLSELTAKLEALEKSTGRQFVIATVNSLNGREIADYGYQLGRHWKIGDEQRDDGVILLVAPKQRQVRIETGYGARVFLTDAVSSVIIRESILPAFRNGDMGGGIVAGADQIIGMMELPPAEAAKRAQEIGAAEQERQSSQGFSIIPMIFIIVIFFMIISGISRAAAGGKRYRGRRGGGIDPMIVLWGIDAISRSSRNGGGWGGGGGFGGGFGGGGGFSGGGGSFGGGGAGGSW